MGKESSEKNSDKNTSQQKKINLAPIVVIVLIVVGYNFYTGSGSKGNQTSGSAVSGSTVGGLTNSIKSFFSNISFGSSLGLSQEGFEKNLKTELQSIDKKNKECMTKLDVFEYFPSGGLRNLYCHLKVFTFPKLSDHFGKQLFTNAKKEMDWKSKTSFLYYNTSTVRGLTDLVNSMSDEFKQYLKSEFNYSQTIQPILTTLHITYAKLQKNPGWRDEQIEKYKKLIASGTDAYNLRSGYFNFISPRFMENKDSNDFFDEGGLNGNVVLTVVAFWLRRHIDGSAEDVHNLVKSILKILEPNLLNETENILANGYGVEYDSESSNEDNLESDDFAEEDLELPKEEVFNEEELEPPPPPPPVE